MDSRAFPERYDPNDPERPFLPPDLFQKDGPWVEIKIDNASAVTATRHVFDFGARSTFRVFLQLREGRKATVEDESRRNSLPRAIANVQDFIDALRPDEGVMAITMVGC